MGGNGSRECEHVNCRGAGYAGPGKNAHGNGQWGFRRAYFKGPFDGTTAHPSRDRIFLDTEISQLVVTLSKKLSRGPGSWVAGWN
jgi:hypothetical protein